jgi:cytochrome c556
MALITASAETINANAQKITTSDWFVEGTSVDSGADTEALPAIWDQTEEFEAAAANLVTKSEAMLAAAQSGDAAAVGANVMELGGACKNCHDNFRLKKD